MRLAPRLLLATGLALGLVLPTVTFAQIPPPCWVPDNGTGTADHPPVYPLGYVGQMQIINGLPPGTTVNINPAALLAFAGLVQVPGGTLGGMQETWTATMPWSMTGTGSLLGYNSNINMPISAGESHSAPRTLFAPLQSFNTDLYRLQGQIANADFDLLRITAGTAFGLPSPGHTIFTQNGTGWGLDSFFDITYRIDFVGKAGGTFGGMSGSTTGTYRFVMCHDPATPARQSTWGRLKQIYR